MDLPPYCRIQSENTGLSADGSEPLNSPVVQESEDVNQHLVRNHSYVYRFRFFIAFECEGMREALSDLRYDALWDGVRVTRIF